MEKPINDPASEEAEAPVWADRIAYETPFGDQDCQYRQAHLLDEFLLQSQKDSPGPLSDDANPPCSISLELVEIKRRPGRPATKPWPQRRRVGLRKVSRCIRLKSTVAGMLDAASHAKRIGKPLNLFISIKPHAMDAMPGEERPRYWKSLISAIGQPLRNVGLSLTHLWSRESCRHWNDGRGEHLHLLIHVPNRSLRRKIEAYLRHRFKGIGELDIRTASMAAKRTSNGRYHNVVLYVLKNMSPNTAHGTNLSYTPGGPILGKRCGCSRDIQPKAVEQWRMAHGIFT